MFGEARIVTTSSEAALDGDARAVPPLTSLTSTLTVCAFGGVAPASNVAVTVTFLSGIVNVVLALVASANVTPSLVVHSLNV